MILPLETSRLRLRLVTLSDLDSMHEIQSFPESDRYNTLGIPENLEQTKKHLETLLNAQKSPEPSSLTFAIEDNKDFKFVGLLGLKLGAKKYKRGEIWYTIHPHFWNQGYATEAVSRILHFGFSHLKLHRMEAGSAVENLGSIKVLEKVGMTREGKMD